MAGMMSLLWRDPMLYEVLREIGLLPQLYEEFLVSNERTVVSLPLRKFSRSLSLEFFSYTSEFYCAFLRHSLPVRNCSLCLERHCQNYLCLPEMFETGAIDILFDMLEWKRSYLSFDDDLVSVVRLCGYLLIKPTIVHAFLVNLLSLSEVRNSKRGPAFAYELYKNGFLETAEYFSQGVDHFCFYNVLKQNGSYRKAKRTVRSYQRYREFAPTYTYPSGKVKFSRVRAAFFWYYYDTPKKDYDEYPATSWC